MSLTGATGIAPPWIETGLEAAVHTNRADRAGVAAHLEQTNTAAPVAANATQLGTGVRAPSVSGSIGAQTPPITLRPDFGSMPAELKQKNNWVLWRYLPPNSDGKKPRKIPYQPNGKTANTTDPSTWSGFEECRLAYERGGFSGIGFTFDGAVGLDGLCYCGVDLDGCIVVATTKSTRSPATELGRSAHIRKSPPAAPAFIA
jgi:hypothetical protein